MRQAGRYLPEYRRLRARAEGFLDFCYTPALAVEATLQPIRRYAFDAAIIFSDILVVPHALGQKVWFEEGQGPRLEALGGAEDLTRLRTHGLAAALAPVYQALADARAALPAETALIGFAGAPWTLATYMLEGGSSREFAAARHWIGARPAAFAQLVEILVEAVAEHLIRQAEAGAEALQIFDSWAGALNDGSLEGDSLRRWSLEPIAEIARRVRAARPDVPLIVFPRGVGEGYRAFAEAGLAAALSLDSAVPLDWAERRLHQYVTLQGNLDPRVLAAGGVAMTEACSGILAAWGGGPFVFNLGHGILPQTPLEHVGDVLELVRGSGA